MRERKGKVSPEDAIKLSTSLLLQNSSSSSTFSLFRFLVVFFFFLLLQLSLVGTSPTIRAVLPTQGPIVISKKPYLEATYLLELKITEEDGKERLLVIGAVSKEDQRAWMEAIEFAIEASRVRHPHTSRLLLILLPDLRSFVFSSSSRCDSFFFLLFPSHPSRRSYLKLYRQRRKTRASHGPTCCLLDGPR